jgi:hypothetical protein
MKQIPLFIDEDTKFTVTERRLVEMALPDDLTDEEMNWLHGHRKAGGVLLFHASARGTNSGDFWFYIPDDEETFLLEYGDAPERLRNILRALFVHYNQEKVEDRGYLLFYAN